MNKIKKIKSASLKKIERKLDIIKKMFENIPVYKGKNQYPYTFLPLTDYKPAMKPEFIEMMADLLVYFGKFEKASIIVSEGDRGGGPLTHAVSMRTGLPYTLANWYPNPTEGTFSVKTSIGYSGDGVISLNGIQKGDRAIIVDDLLSSGGTVVGLIKCIKHAGGRIIEADFVGEKANIGGRQKLNKLFHIPVKSLVKFTTEGKFTKLL